MLCDSCEFETRRLLVREWRSLTPSEWTARDLADVVRELLTEEVTRSLPEAWRGAYSRERAARWIEERNQEGTTLLVVEKASKRAAGLMILFECDGESGVEVRLGYLLDRSQWGKGLASELLGGFVGWCRQQPTIGSLAGGVEHDNVASQRVLEKCGFQAADDELGSGELLYRLELRGGGPA